MQQSQHCATTLEEAQYTVQPLREQLQAAIQWEGIAIKSKQV